MHAVSPAESELNLPPSRLPSTACLNYTSLDADSDAQHAGFSFHSGLHTPPGDHPGRHGKPLPLFTTTERSEASRARADPTRGPIRPSMGSTTYDHPSMYGRYDQSSTSSSSTVLANGVNGDYSQLPEAERKRAILSDSRASYLRVPPLSSMPIPLSSKDLSPEYGSPSAMSSRTARSQDSDYAYSSHLSSMQTQSDMERQHARMARDAFGAAGSSSSRQSSSSYQPQSQQPHRSAQQQVQAQQRNQTQQAQAISSAAARAVIDSIVNASSGAGASTSRNADASINTNAATSNNMSQSRARNSADALEPTPQSWPITVTDKESIVLVKHSLSIPRFISPEGGSLPDFVAEMTCFFWFESPKAYKNIDTIDQVPSDTWVPRLSPHAVPNASFKTWVSRMLTTTQVTQNVVLLALLFIYRLKTWNNFVHGKPGSEFRLLTVALMLGNKFLDDNTYTNRTWSDVSMLNVKEIHVMEVEFLSNMRYGLLVSKAEWDAWLVKLAKFRIFYKRASNAVLVAPNLSPPRSLSSIMMSPQQQRQAQAQAQAQAPSQSQSQSHNVSPASVYSVASSIPTLPQLSQWAPQLPPNIPTLPSLSAVSSSATYNLPDHIDINKPTSTSLSAPHNKRPSAVFDDVTEPPPKRSNRFMLPTTSSGTATLPPLMSQSQQQADIATPFTTGSGSVMVLPTADSRRLPAPQLSLNTAAANSAQMHLHSQIQQNQTQLQGQMQMQNQLQAQAQANQVVQAVQAAHAAHAYQQSQQAQQATMSLPPLAHGMRAMATVFPNTTTSSLPAPLLTTTAPTNIPSLSATTPTTYNAPSFSTPTKRMSPMNAGLAGAAAGPQSSPLSENFAQHMAANGVSGVSGVHTPISHSPSIYLQQRPSPYRPIRHVHMLLNPPSSTSLQDYNQSATAGPPLLIPPPQMYYQPLGRPNDVRSGIVPEFQEQLQQYHAARQAAAMAPMHALQQHHQQQHHQQHQQHQQQHQQNQQIAAELYKQRHAAAQYNQQY